MVPLNSYREWLKQDLSGLVETLAISDLQKRFMRSRWLDQVLWMEGRANHARDRYYALRLITIIGGVIVPALVSLNLSSNAASAIRWATFGLSLLVAISAAVEEFFHYGERWKHYRQIVESLKIEGWKFFQFTEPYRSYKTQAEAYPVFAARVEEIIQRDVDVYITEVVKEKTETEEEQDG